MKLSNIDTEKGLDILCEITPYLGAITADEELFAELRQEVAGGQRMTRAQMVAVGADKIGKLIPIILKKHRADVYGILSVLNEKSPEEIAKQNFLITGAQIRDVVKDKALLDFFKSFVDTEQTE
jgi:hypothetical protein